MSSNCTNNSLFNTQTLEKRVRPPETSLRGFSI